MSTNRPSDLRRSNSSSSIPIATRASRPPQRNSIQKPRGKSVSRPTADRKPSDRTLKRSNSTSNFLDVPRLSRQGSGSLARQTNYYDGSKLSRQGSGSLARQNSMTPLSQAGRSARRSPLLSSVKKDNRPVSDKGWQYEQLVKVRSFIAEKMDYIDYNSVKSGISLDVFIDLVHNLFQCIDKRINITRENYIEGVASNLKRYHYPASVKPSLMKTVNTPHSWPHVLAILSWLVDFVIEINQDYEEEYNIHTIVANANIEACKHFNKAENENEDAIFEYVVSKMSKELDEHLNINENAVDQIDQEIKNLNAELMEFDKKRNTALSEIESVKVEIKEISDKCDAYETENANFESLAQEQMSKYVDQIKKIDEELISATATEDQLKSLIDAQAYTVEEKVQLTEEIKALQNTRLLKEEKCVHQEELMKKCDFKLTCLKKKVEENAYKYNKIIRELSSSNEDFKRFYIPVTGFTQENIKKTLKEINLTSKACINQLKEDQKAICEEINDKQQMIKQIEEETASVYSKVEKLSALDLELAMTLECDVKKYKTERENLLSKRNSITNKLKELQEKKEEILTPLKEKVTQLETSIPKLILYRETLNTSAVKFFTSLLTLMMNENDTYMKQMTEISATILAKIKSQIDCKKSNLQQIAAAREIENRMPK